MFCLPAGPQSIIGTTDTWTDESPESVHASTADVDYLLRAANAYFPRAQLQRDDVISAWAGIRPLVSATAVTPNLAPNSCSNDVTLGPTVDIQFEPNASATKPCSRPPM